VVDIKSQVDGIYTVVFSIEFGAFSVLDILNQYFFNFAANKLEFQSALLHKLLAKLLSIQFWILISADSIKYS